MTNADRLWSEIVADMIEDDFARMTDDELQAELDSVEPVPMSPGRIQEIVDYAVGRAQIATKCGHDYPDSTTPYPWHFHTHKCRRCGKGFSI